MQSARRHIWLWGLVLMKWYMYSGNKLHKEITSRVNSSFYCVPCAVFKFFVSIELFNPQKYTPFNSMQCLLVCSVWAHCNPRASHSAVYAHEHTWYILVFHPPALPVFFSVPYPSGTSHLSLSLAVVSCSQKILTQTAAKKTWKVGVVAPTGIWLPDLLFRGPATWRWQGEDTGETGGRANCNPHWWDPQFLPLPTHPPYSADTFLSPIYLSNLLYSGVWK